MRYERIYDGKFLERPNRFIAYVEIEGARETVHVKNKICPVWRKREYRRER